MDEESVLGLETFPTLPPVFGFVCVLQHLGVSLKTYIPIRGFDAGAVRYFLAVSWVSGLGWHDMHIYLHSHNTRWAIWLE